MMTGIMRLNLGRIAYLGFCTTEGADVIASRSTPCEFFLNQCLNLPGVSFSIGPSHNLSHEEAKQSGFSRNVSLNTVFMVAQYVSNNVSENLGVTYGRGLHTG